MIYSAFWTSTASQGFSDDAKLLGVYLLSCSHGTIAGVCRLSDGYVSDDLAWSVETVRKGFDELSAKGFADRCEATKWVWVRKFLEWNRPENPNQWKAVRKVVDQIPEQCSWRAEFISFLASLPGSGYGDGGNPSGTVTQTVSKSHTHSDSHPHSDTQPNPTQNITAAPPPTHRQVSRGTSAQSNPEWMLDFKVAYPNRAGDQGWRKALKAANARLAEGHTAAEFIAGALRYAEFCKAAGKTGTEYVKQACTFLGPDKPFLLPWHPPPRQLTATERILQGLNGNDDSRVIEHEPERKPIAAAR